MIRLSANLGFLWTDRPLPEAIHAAARAGFDAIELHWPYDIDPALVRKALDETGLPVLGLNTVRGDVAAGDFGLCALAGRQGDACRAIDQAFGYAAAIGAANVHVMAGKASGDEARRIFVENLRYAARVGKEKGVSVLIEPLNTRDVPGYFLTDAETARSIIDETACDNIRIMYDCYHMRIMGADLIAGVGSHLPAIGHVQFAAVPDRGEPDQGEVDYARLLPAIVEQGYTGFLGAEYKPRGASTDAGLGWLADFRARWQPEGRTGAAS
ncbi:MAG TPA: TIM barrel protein [Rhizobiaceae bacterium]|nr:TIM barrel protein [Rhizobiaceae bacterium]